MRIEVAMEGHLALLLAPGRMHGLKQVKRPTKAGRKRESGLDWPVSDLLYYL
jgi:hypothetical protein